MEHTCIDHDLEASYLCTGCERVAFMMAKANTEESKEEALKKKRYKRNACIYPWHVKHKAGTSKRRLCREILIKKYPKLGEAEVCKSHKVVDKFIRKNLKKGKDKQCKSPNCSNSELLIVGIKKIMLFKLPWLLPPLLPPPLRSSLLSLLFRKHLLPYSRALHHHRRIIRHQHPRTP